MKIEIGTNLNEIKNDTKNIETRFNESLQMMVF